MNIVKCAIDGCSTQFETADAVAVNVRFICKNHPRAEQVRAAGRAYDPEADNVDAKIKFQPHQFDKDLRRAGKPVGTSHIANQGSDIPLS